MVQKDHKLVMLFGDNLLDFTDPKEATAESREALIEKHKDDFGKKYIIFPNPMYGSWKLRFTTITIKQVTKQKINYVKMLLSNSILKQAKLNNI